MVKGKELLSAAGSSILAFALIGSMLCMLWLGMAPESPLNQSHTVQVSPHR